ncbi:YwiB family protein [Neobacillus sp. Marseille-QA0830]
MALAEIPVKISVKTTIDQEETIELMVFGRYYQKEKASFLQYEEAMEAGSVRTIVKMTPDEALILRSGAVKMRLPFTLQKKLRGSYEMPFGVFETTTNTKSLTFTFENGKGLMDILYEFAMQGEHAGTYHLEISFQEDRT